MGPGARGLGPWSRGPDLGARGPGLGAQCPGLGARGPGLGQHGETQPAGGGKHSRTPQCRSSRLWAPGPGAEARGLGPGGLYIYLGAGPGGPRPGPGPRVRGSGPGPGARSPGPGPVAQGVKRTSREVSREVGDPKIGRFGRARQQAWPEVGPRYAKFCKWPPGSLSYAANSESPAAEYFSLALPHYHVRGVSVRSGYGLPPV